MSRTERESNGGDDGDFNADFSPLNAVQLAEVARAGREAGRNIKAAGRELNSEGHLAEEEEKNVTCFLTTKAVDHELPENGEEFAREIGECFSESVAAEEFAARSPMGPQRSPRESI